MKYLLACAAIAAVAANAFASGDYGPSYTMFKAYTKPDIPNARFQAGDLGVLQPGMRRVYLYTAWRAIMLGAPVVKKPGTEKAWTAPTAARSATGGTTSTAKTPPRTWSGAPPTS